MRMLIRLKFTQNPDLRTLLLTTGDRLLVEGNMWHDNYWGICACSKCTFPPIPQTNWLGKILMEERDAWAH